MKKALCMILGLLILVSVFCCLTAYADDGEQAQEIHVPQIRVVTNDNVGVTLQKDDGYVDASVEITDTDGNTSKESVVFKVRGNGTALPSILKKAYTFKFAKKRDVLGLGKGKKWALLANAMDVSLLRNYITFDFAQNMDLRYTSAQKMVELWVDGSFRGLYTLMEPVQEGKDRVNIDIESNGGKKDFLLELEARRTEDGVTYIKTDDMRFAINEPEEPNKDQTNYIRGVLTQIVSTMKNGTEQSIRSVVDVESFVKFYILNEYVNTVDFDFSSVFFYYQDGKLCAGPPWDYDHAMGSGGDVTFGSYKKAAETEGVYAGTMHFYRYLCKYDWFMDEVKAVYAANRAYIANIAADGGLIDTLASTYSREIERNFTDAGWKVTKQWSVYQRKPLPTYQENLDYLKSWCQARFNWLDSYLTGTGSNQENTEPTEGEFYFIGDADGDLRLTIFDATAIQTVLVELPTNNFVAAAADVDADGFVTVLDVTAIQRSLADMPTKAEIWKKVYITA